MYTNKHNIDLPLAIFLAYDSYDHSPVKVENPNNIQYISATSLIKPIKSIILGHRTVNDTRDIIDFLASRVGTSIHDRLESAFKNFKAVAKTLGYSAEDIKDIEINPSTPSKNAIYLERRAFKEVLGVTIGGKFDIVYQGTIRDLKTTKTYTWTKQNFEDYKLQGSIYRWLNQDIIVEDYMYIDFLFTDWKEHLTNDPNYPQLPVISHKLPLWSLDATERLISNKVSMIKKLADKAQEQLPLCTQEELWQEPNKYAYFKNPTSSRATKVFDNYLDASTRLSADGNVGRIDTRYGEPKRCTYCNAVSICEQAQQMANLKGK